jgi:NADH:ubiquinone oxidoreductase subunit E
MNGEKMAVRKKKSAILLNILHDEQSKKGYISEAALKRISSKYGIPISRLYGVVSFYALLRTKPQGKHVIEICGSPACVLNDAVTLESFLKAELGIPFGSTTTDGLFSLYLTSCIGCCDEAPAMLLDGKPHTKLTVERLRDLFSKLRSEAGAKRAAKDSASAKPNPKK